MSSKRTLRQVAVAVMLLVAFLFQGTWALAGTTGGVTGQVTDSTGAPVAGAKVVVSSPSQQASGTTDNAGRFTFLSLAPDTYSLAIEKNGYDPISYTGVSVFADNNLTLAFKMNKTLKTIAKVTSRSTGDVVKSGVGSDIYNVNATAIQKSAALGGGSNLNSAYSAIAAVPGVTVPIGGMGWNQGTYIRGSQSFFTGFEYDGIPVNRAFDNYVASTESNLGLQELQVYTGGGPSSNSSSGTSGFINQVIKTGTYPGSGTLGAGIGGPTFYHQLKVEAGGATPDRNFSYYVGLSGYNQDYRTIDNNNGSGVEAPGQVYSGYSTATQYAGWIPGIFGLGDGGSGLGVPNYNRSVSALCNADGTTPSSVTGLSSYGVANAAWAKNGPGAPWGQFNTCLDPFNGNFGNVSTISDRENIINFHFGIPRKNGLRDDLQLLYSSSSMKTFFLSSSNDAGGPLNEAVAATGATIPGGASGLLPNYSDASAVYDLPFGTPITGKAPAPYYYPSSPQDRAIGGTLPDNFRDNIWNDTGIVKLQYTHALSSTAYLRGFAYTFFSDWNQAGPDSGYNQYQWGVGGPIDGSVAANYDLITHTAGGELQFADQVNEKNLVQFTGNYTMAHVSRFNNTGFFAGSSPIGLISGTAQGNFQCWNPATGTSIACYKGGYKSNAAKGPTGTPPAGSPAAVAGAQWVTLWNGNSSGSDNTIRPNFAFLSLSDEFRPNDKFLIDASLRYENYTYNLDQSTGLGDQFYSQIVAQYVCQNSSTGVVDTQPLPPGAPPPAPVNYEATCPAGYAHPAFTAVSPSTYKLNYWSPRLSATYTQSPDTVWRASAGRFTEPPISASVQYLSRSGDDRTVWNATLPLGFTSPYHPIPGMSAAQYDFSLERHIRGTDVSFKLSPFYNFTNQYQEQNFIGPNFVTQAPVGDFRSYGIEGSLTKGDFSRDGLSGQLSLTYTNAKVRFKKGMTPNQLDQVNGVIDQYNALTSAGGGAKCYTAATNNGGVVLGSPDNSCAAPTDIANPYYGMSAQAHIDTNGWYAPGDVGLSASQNPSTTYFDSPWVAAMILNYRKSKFAITPSVQLSQGSSYGGPMDFNGVDPRACLHNSAADGITAASPGTNPLQCDYMSSQALIGAASPASSQLFIPNPQTGSFAIPGAFRNPWILVGNVQMSYDLSPRVSASLTLGNVFHTCFGGTKASWTSTYGPGSNICAYGPNSYYVSNFYNGTSPSDVAANGVTPYAWQTVSYSPRKGSDAGFLPTPFTAFLQVQIKL